MTFVTKPAILSLLLAAGAVALSGCNTNVRDSFRLGTQEANPAPCPNVIVLQDAGRKITFSGEERLENIAYTAEITNVRSSCRYFDQRPIEAEVTVDFALGRGPTGGSDSTQLNYFVAVTRTDRDLIAKEQFTVPVEFRGNDAVSLTDTIGKITIPRRDDQVSGVNFEIVVGLSLSREELLFNRSGKSLKFPDLD